MSLKRDVLEGLVSLIAQTSGAMIWEIQPPKRIFVLRNNDIGDLLVITPVFEALKKAFPHAEIIAGIGSWNHPVLENNPYVDVVLTLDAPWHNKQSTTTPHNSLLGFFRSLKYILFSSEVRTLKSMKCDTGIDILGSPEGSLLMLKVGIKNRIGVQGYAGGHSACQRNLTFDIKRHVSQAALDQANLLIDSNTPGLIPAKPQIYLTQEEISRAENTWSQHHASNQKKPLRVLIGAGAGLVEKCWPSAFFGELAHKISQKTPTTLVSVGTHQDSDATQEIKKHTPQVLDLCGKTSLRETFSMSATADLILCNSSMLMHSGAAFDTHTAVFLGPDFKSAKAHAYTWGYPDTCMILGPEPFSPRQTTPQEAYEKLLQKQWI